MESHQVSFEGSSQDSKKRKFGPTALSCQECRRRKMKCDRSQPCGPCKKRQCEDLCIWDSGDTAYDPESPSAATRDELKVIRSRLDRVEAALGFRHSNTGKRQDSEKNFPASESSPSTSTPGDLRTNTEDATKAIESATFASKIFGYTTPGQDERIVKKLSSTPALVDQTDCNTSVQVDVEQEITGTPSEGFLYMLGPHASRVDLIAARRNEISQLCRLLPDELLTRVIIHEFTNAPDWMYSCVAPEIFSMEVSSFWRMVERGTYTDVDPLFLAVYFMVAALAVEGYFIRHETDVQKPIIPIAFSSQPPIWVAAAERALQIGNYTGKPRIRSIQTVILFGQYSQLTAATERPAEFLSMLAVAIRILTLFGIHKLGADSSTMPPDDPALPRGANSMKRQMALRLLGIICFLDFVHVSNRGRTHLLHPGQIDTELLMNVNNRDLSLYSSAVTRLPDNALTDATADRVRFQVAKQVQRLNEVAARNGLAGMSYDTVMDFDQEFTRILNSLPELWRRASAFSPLDASELSSLTSKGRYQLYSTLDHIYNRIMRLHRPFLSSKDPQHLHSTQQCTRSAAIVIRSIHEIRELIKFKWQTYSHALGASIVLSYDLFGAIDKNVDSHTIMSRKRLLSQVTDIFSMQVSLKNLGFLIKRGAYVTDSLLAAVDKRLHNVGRSPSQNVEAAFSELLQSISQGLAAMSDELDGAVVGASHTTEDSLFLSQLMRDIGVNMDVNITNYHDNLFWPDGGDVSSGSWIG